MCIRDRPYRESDIGNNKDIRIIRVTEEKVDKEEKIEYAIQRLPTKELDKGETKVVQRGETGLRNKEIKVTYEDGKETRREIIKEEVIIKPRDEIIQVGVNDTITLSLIHISKGLEVLQEEYNRLHQLLEDGRKVLKGGGC